MTTSLEARATAIVLVGPSSSGKTTVAELLRRSLIRPSLFLSGDDLDLPQSAEAVRLLRSNLPDLPLWERRFYLAFFRAMAGVVASDLHAIGEMIFKAPAHVAAYEEALVTTPRLLVRLTATGETRQARETARGDRLAGTAVRTAAEEFVPPNMDLTIATDELPPAEVAEQVIAALR